MELGKEGPDSGLQLLMTTRNTAPTADLIHLRGWHLASAGTEQLQPLLGYFIMHYITASPGGLAWQRSPVFYDSGTAGLDAGPCQTLQPIARKAQPTSRVGIRPNTHLVPRKGSSPSAPPMTHLLFAGNEASQILNSRYSWFPFLPKLKQAESAKMGLPTPSQSAG